jgi:hypothetical protein
MGLGPTLWALGAVSLLGLVSAVMNARRGIGRWSLVPWDWLLVAAMFGGVMLGAHAARIWSGGE